MRTLLQMRTFPHLAQELRDVAHKFSRDLPTLN